MKAKSKELCVFSSLTCLTPLDYQIDDPGFKTQLHLPNDTKSVYQTWLDLENQRQEQNIYLSMNLTLA